MSCTRSLLGGCVVLIDDAAEYLPALDRCARRHDSRRVVVGWSLLSGLVRAVTVVVAGELAEHRPEVPFVVDQHPVGALGPGCAYPSLGVAVGPRRQLHLIPAIGVAGYG